MAAGVTFDISIEAENVGVDAAADQLNALAEQITMVNTVATKFDTAVNAVRSRLEEATSVTKAAAAALGLAETRYKELESAANKAAKEVEKAALAGKDVTALAAAAEVAKAAMTAQAGAVDDLRIKSDAAVAAQTKLAGSLKVLEGQQAAAAATIKKEAAAADAAAIAATKAASASAALAENKRAELAATAAAAKVAAQAKKAEEIAAAKFAARDERMKHSRESAAMFGKATLASAAALAAVAAAGVAAIGVLGHFAVSSSPTAVMRLTAANERMKRGMTGLFSGLKLDKFVGALEDVGTLFDKGTSSANGMKVLIETIFQPLFDGAASAGPYVKEMFKGLIYGALQVVIAVLKIRNAIFAAMSPELRSQIKSVIDAVFTLENAFKVGTAIVIAFAAAIVVVAGLLVGLVVVAASPFILMAAAIARVYYGILLLGDAWKAFTGWATGAKDVVGNFITGLVNGIKEKAGAVWQAMKDMALGGIKSFTDTFKIGSPSKVMHMQGVFIGEGTIDGIEEVAPDVQDAMGSMVSPGDAGAGSTNSTTTSSSNSKTVIIQQVTFAGPDGQSQFAAFRAMLAEALDGGTITIGSVEAPAT